MPTVVTHALAGATLAGLCAPRPLRAPGMAGWLLLCGAAAMLPDLDVITFKLGIPYASPWGHRGVSHSLTLALIAGGLLAAFGRRWWEQLGLGPLRAFVVLSLAVASHALLDMWTDATHGPALAMPWHQGRFLFDWRPIEGSPLTPSRWLGPKGLRVLSSELLYVWLPCLLLWMARAAWLRGRGEGGR